jgi:glycosyltransferase involved in cell wall biosynthesis
MIVKNEAHCLARCLESVKHIIDCFVIVDTGSTDNTKEVIRTVLKDIPGEIIDRPWVDFGHNRTEAIVLAEGKADYLLVIDADDELEGPKPTDLDADYYNILVYYGDLVWERTHLFKAVRGFRYIGILHEYLDHVCSLQTLNGQPLKTVKYICHPDGARSVDGMSAKFTRDALILERAFCEDPFNTRYAFYLAESLRQAGRLDEAYKVYGHRARMKEDAEGWYSLLQRARINVQEQIGSEAELIDGFLRAFEARRFRIEPMFELGMYLQERNRHNLCCALLKPLVETPIPNDLFVDRSVYTWGLKAVLAISAFNTGDIQMCRDLFEWLIHCEQVPKEEHDRFVDYFNKIKKTPGFLFTTNSTGDAR